VVAWISFNCGRKTALRALAREVKEKIEHSITRLLVNVSTPEAAALALAAGADGVHLAGKPTLGAAGHVREAFRRRVPVISVPCHSLEDVDVAYEEKVDLMLFSPVFEKVSGDEMFAPQGLEGLRAACIPVLALGGVTAGNAPDCIAAGAAGIAGIRLFAGDDWRRL
jgi:thiamine-phosphate pyrophosphorylase